MASGNSSLLKGAFVLLFIGAVFAGLTFILDEAPEQTPTASTPSNSDDSATNDPAVVEAQEIGAQIGARVGEEIGRRVGEILVANLDIPTSPDADTSEDSMMMADASDSTMSEEAPAEEAMAEPEPAIEEEPKMVAETEEAAAETDSDDMESAADGMDSEAVMTEPEPTPSHTIANEPAIPAPTPTVESEPDPSKNFVFSSSGWWNESANGKGLRVVHVGQAVSASGINRSIVVILSAPYKGTQNLEQKIKVSNASGNPVAGVWRRSANARNLFMHVDDTGTYQVNFADDLASRDGLSLGMNLTGPVKIQ